MIYTFKLGKLDVICFRYFYCLMQLSNHMESQDWMYKFLWISATLSFKGLCTSQCDLIWIEIIIELDLLKVLKGHINGTVKLGVFFPVR